MKIIFLGTLEFVMMQAIMWPFILKTIKISSIDSDSFCKSTLIQSSP